MEKLGEFAIMWSVMFLATLPPVVILVGDEIGRGRLICGVALALLLGTFAGMMVPRKGDKDGNG